MKLLIYLSIMGLYFLVACNSSETNKKLNEVGDVGGKAIGELVSGVSHGVKEAFEPQIALSKELRVQGLELGKSSVQKDSLGHTCLLTVYIIANKEFSGDILAKVSDSDGSEIGRLKIEFTAKKDEAKYIDLKFDPRTEINSGSYINLE